MTLPLKIVHKTIVDWAATLEDAETAQDWVAVRHTRLSMEQVAILMMYRIDRKAAEAPPMDEPPA